MKIKRVAIILFIVPGVIISLPISFYLAEIEIKYHPFWQAFFMSFFIFWVLIDAIIITYFYVIVLKNSLKILKNKKQ